MHYENNKITVGDAVLRSGTQFQEKVEETMIGRQQCSTEGKYEIRNLPWKRSRLLKFRERERARKLEHLLH